MSERTKNERITELEDLVAGINSRLNSQERWIAQIEEAQINLRKDESAVTKNLNERVGRLETSSSGNQFEIEVNKLAQRVQMLEMEARATPGWAGNSNLPKGAPLPAEPNVRLSDRTNAQITKEKERKGHVGMQIRSRIVPGDVVTLTSDDGDGFWSARCRGTTNIGMVCDEQIGEAWAIVAEENRPPSDPDLFHDIASYLRNGAAREDEVSGHKGTRFALYNRMIHAKIICCRCLRGGKIWPTGLCTVCAANTNPPIG
jgi:hypothetical protein